MKWPPALIGALIGLFLTRHWLGALIGALLAGPVLRTWRSWRASPPTARANSALGAVFSLLGQLAKADGRVCEREIAFCEQVIQRLNLDERGRRAAVNAFNTGKQPGFDALRSHVELRHARSQALVFLEIFVELALVDGQLHASEKQLLRRISWMLGVREWTLQRMLDRRQPRSRPARPAEPDPYTVLGVDRRASTDDIRRAFRKLMSRHHPDKLAAAGASPEAIALAQERTTQILAAWEQIKSARGMT
ncbi:MAG: co-chaperone DjlA [Xanthomonadales bacterium]|nr:co-chaperone DjlA [Xanthomonadales bacterium]